MSIWLPSPIDLIPDTNVETGAALICVQFGKTFLQGFHHKRWCHPRNISTEFRNFPNRAGTDVKMLLVGHDGNCFDLGSQFTVGKSHTELKLEIRKHP